MPVSFYEEPVINVTVNNLRGEKGDTGATGPTGPAGEVTDAELTAALALKANLASPTFTGTVTVPTAVVSGAAVTKAQMDTADALKANLASPALTGVPSAPTPATADNTTKIATTAYVKANRVEQASADLAAYAPKADPTFTGVPSAPTPSVDTNTTQLATTAYVKANRAAQAAIDNSQYAPVAGDDEAYGAGWNGATDYPTKNAVYDKVETLGSAIPQAPVTVTDTTDTLAAADNGKVNIYTEATLVTITLPTDASDDLADGFESLLVAAGSGGIALDTTGLTLIGANPTTTAAQDETIFVKKTAAANTWLVIGPAETASPATVVGTTDTLAAADDGTVILYTAAGAVTVTLANIATGFEAVLVSLGAGGLSVDPGVMSFANSFTPKLTVAQGEALYVKQTAASTWIVLGGTAT